MEKSKETFDEPKRKNPFEREELQQIQLTVSTVYTKTKPKSPSSESVPLIGLLKGKIGSVVKRIHTLWEDKKDSFQSIAQDISYFKVPSTSGGELSKINSPIRSESNRSERFSRRQSRENAKLVQRRATFLNVLEYYKNALVDEVKEDGLQLPFLSVDCNVRPTPQYSRENSAKKEKILYTEQPKRYKKRTDSDSNARKKNMSEGYLSRKRRKRNINSAMNTPTSFFKHNLLENLNETEVYIYLIVTKFLKLF